MELLPGTSLHTPYTLPTHSLRTPYALPMQPHRLLQTVMPRKVMLQAQGCLLVPPHTLPTHSLRTPYAHPMQPVAAADSDTAEGNAAVARLLTGASLHTPYTLPTHSLRNLWLPQTLTLQKVMPQ
jgi:hypothetical protein